MIASGNVISFLKFDYKNDVGLYFLAAFWEGPDLFKMHPISGVGISISVPSFSPTLF